ARRASVEDRTGRLLPLSHLHGLRGPRWSLLHLRLRRLLDLRARTGGSHGHVTAPARETTGRARYVEPDRREARSLCPRALDPRHVRRLGALPDLLPDR